MLSIVKCESEIPTKEKKSIELLCICLIVLFLNKTKLLLNFLLTDHISCNEITVVMMKIDFDITF